MKQTFEAGSAGVHNALQDPEARRNATEYDEQIADIISASYMRPSGHVSV